MNDPSIPGPSGSIAAGPPQFINPIEDAFNNFIAAATRASGLNSVEVAPVGGTANNDVEMVDSSTTSAPRPPALEAIINGPPISASNETSNPSTQEARNVDSDTAMEDVDTANVEKSLAVGMDRTSSPPSGGSSSVVVA